MVETFRWNPAGGSILSGKAWPAAGSESCVVAESSVLRSVDSGCAGRAIEPRKKRVAGADAVRKAEGRTDAPQSAWREGPAGVIEQGTHTGVLQELERPGRFHPKRVAWGIARRRAEAPGPSTWPVSSRGAKYAGVDGTDKRRKTKRVGMSDRESEHSIVPVKQGNPSLGRPCRGKGMS